MGIMEAIGWVAITWGGTTALPVADAINEYNTNFATTVDSGDSCFDRVDGVVGTYGGPNDYELDLLCNYRLQSYEVEEPVTKWRLIRK